MILRFEFAFQGGLFEKETLLKQVATAIDNKATLDGLCIKFDSDDTAFITNVIKYGWVGISAGKNLNMRIPICTFYGQIIGNSTLHYKLFVSRSLPDGEVVTAALKFEKSFMVNMPNTITLYWYKGV